MKFQLLLICAVTAFVCDAADDTKCKQAAKACFDDNSKSVITFALEENPMDVYTACTIYKTVVDCVEKVNKTYDDCGANDADIKSVLTDASSAAYEFCEKNGNVKPCSVQVVGCYSAMTQAAKYLLKTGQMQQTCGYRQVYLDCTKDIDANNRCSQWEKDFLNTYLENFNTQTFKDKCDNACGKKAGECLKTLASVFTKQPLPDNTCTLYKQDLDCLEGLKTDTDCNGKADQIAADIAVYDASDFCNKDGTKAKCWTTMDQCSSTLNAATINQLPKEQRCGKLNEFLECSRNADCSESYKTGREGQLKSEILRNEQLQTCESLGDCKEQWSSCWYNVMSKMTPGTGGKDLCEEAKTSDKCACNVKKSYICRNDQATLTKDKVNLGKEYNLTAVCKSVNIPLPEDCGAGVALQVSVVTTICAFVLSLVHYL